MMSLRLSSARSYGQGITACLVIAFVIAFWPGNANAGPNVPQLCQQRIIVSEWFNNGTLVGNTRAVTVATLSSYYCYDRVELYFGAHMLASHWPGTPEPEFIDVNALSILNIEPIYSDSEPAALVLSLDEARLSEQFELSELHDYSDAACTEIIDILNLTFEQAQSYTHEQDVHTLHVQANQAALLKLGCTDAILDSLNGSWRAHD